MALLRARIILPVCAPPIEDGAVLISANRIRVVGTWNDLKGSAPAAEVSDLGEVVLLPGLINAHCHLDYTDLAGLIPPPKTFPDWIKSLLALKATWSYTDFAESWVLGAQMLERTGTTSVADIEAVPELLPEVWSSTQLRVFSFLEMTSVRSRRDPHEVLRSAEAEIKSLPHTKNSVGLSPHALYSTTPDLLRLSAEKAREKNWRLTTHIAESAEEFEMYCHASGSLFQWLKPQRDMSDCGGLSPVAQSEKCGLLGPNFLAVHVNYLAAGDAARLAKAGAGVVHCPRSHEYFHHQPFPYAELVAAGVNVCLGTDSLASVEKQPRHKTELNMFAEMQAFAKRFRDVRPEEILSMSTRNAARALGREHEIGCLAENAFADLITVPFSRKTSEVWDSVVRFSGQCATMIDGQWLQAK